MLKEFVVRASFSLIFVLVTLVGIAQGTIRGAAIDKDSGEPAIFVNVYLDGTNYGVTTDLQGFYTLNKIPAGTYTIVATSMEYEASKSQIVVVDNRIVTKDFTLKKATIELGGAEVTADRDAQQKDSRVSVATIRPQDIKKIPSFGGQPDLVQVLQVLPGFVSTGDQGGQLYIRGGSPVQNKVLLDGMVIYNAFHSIGLFSVFDTDIISNADVYTGGFGAEFGGRISSVMNITTKDGNKKRLSGSAGISPFGAKLTLEGPLKKLGDDGSSISYILSAKTSYLEESSKLLYTYVDEDGLPFNYTDLYGKITLGSKAGSKVSLFGFNFSDDVRYQALSKLNWNNYGGGGKFFVVPGGSPVLISGYLSTSRYKINLEEENLEPRFSGVNSSNFGLDFKYSLRDDEILYGVQGTTFKTSYQTFNALGIRAEQEENTTEFGLYFKYKLTHGKLIFEPSIRGHYYGSLSVFSPEPRLAAKFKFNERLRIKMAAGIYSQNLIAANSDRDVVNLFYGFLAGPENLQDEFVMPNGETREVKDPLQRASHAILGFEFDITEKINLNVEGYVKKFGQVTNTNRNKLFPDTPEYSEVSDALKKDFVIESGLAKGVDVVIKYEEKYTYLWFVYSLGDVDRWDGFQWYDPVFDRRHNINFVASQAFGKKHDWEVNVRWNFGSGLPFTQTQGFYQPVSIDEGIGSDYLAQNPDELGITYGGLNEGRLPTYHRLDISLHKSFKFGERVSLDVSAGVTNVYSRANVFYVNRVTNEVVEQLPFMPSIGLDFKF
ncbi:MAG: carboxypeptidase-like regulatory domain-containing protein [Flavobacteriales bacterium]|nr:carboxypeptidase-like regulatory domain-containing protein [Flavobacteriales bacterium]